MTASFECNVKKETRNMERVRRLLLPFCILHLSLFTGSGCRQKMAEQPYYRPYEPTDSFPDGRSNRPLERGVIQRAQHIEIDPFVTGLTRDEWARFFAQQTAPIPPAAPVTISTPIENRELAIGAPRFDPPGFKPEPGKAHPGPQIFVDEFPFQITGDDLKRGQERFTIYCSVCHGPLGNGQGKIWERGYLAPTSFHTEKVGEHEVTAKGPVPLGHSRGYALWGIDIPLREVPVGYYFEVITKGYGGMPSYSAQIPPADRWRIIAYVRVLQKSQHATATDPNLPPEVLAAIKAGGKQ